MAALAWEMSRRYRDFLTNCETAKKESADWKCYSELNTAYWTLADYGERYRLLQFKGAGMHELVHEMKLLNNTKGVQLEDALDEILNTLKKYYPPDNFDRNTVVSQLETIANRVLVADLGATSTTSTASPTPTSATASK